MSRRSRNKSRSVYAKRRKRIVWIMDHLDGNPTGASNMPKNLSLIKEAITLMRYLFTKW